MGNMKSMWEIWLEVELVLLQKKNFLLCSCSTYKFNCRVIKSEDGDVYKSENILERRVDKVLDEETHLPIERCYGVAITGIESHFTILWRFF